jgi:hypothetical protein
MNGALSGFSTTLFETRNELLLLDAVAPCADLIPNDPERLREKRIERLTGSAGAAQVRNRASSP